MRWLQYYFVAAATLADAGPLRLIVEEILDAGADLVDSVSDFFEVPHEVSADEDRVIGLTSESGCAKYRNKCKDCLKTNACVYCETGGLCTEEGNGGECTSGLILKKRKCPGGLNWWQILLIVLACICLAPLIALCCFMYVIKKLCCPNDTEMDD